MRRIRLLAATIALFATLTVLAATEGAAQTTYNRTSAPARPVGSASVVLKPTQINFDFGGTTTSLGPNGDWTIKALVSHRGLLCATYSVGIRYGIGSPGCSNVVWLTDVTYATEQRQCNNAAVYHAGGDVQPKLVDSFARITCAERVVRCSGICK
jgi:hypothetical protein